MKPTIMVCLLFPALVDAQSLGDAAKKERERRDKLKGSAAPKTVTDEELASNKGSIANDSKPASDVTAVPAQTGDGETAALKRDVRHSGPNDGAASEAYWRAQATQARARVEQARRRYDAIQGMIRFGSGHRDESGQVVIYSNQQLKTMGDKAEADVKAAEAALERLVDDGRRAGALPGWLR